MIIDSPNKADVPALRALWRQAFGDEDSFLDLFFGIAYAPNRARCLRLEGRITSALYWFDCELDSHRIAYVYAVATDSEYRGRGLCRALMENTHKHLADLGYSSAILVPGSEELFGFYRALGYEMCSSVDLLSVTASSRRAKLTAISADEYASLRPKYLPRGGVIREGESIAFLDSLATLYSGDGFILAVEKRADALRAVELLGDRSRAAEIVAALGCTTGMFTVPGNQKPQTMIHQLDNNTTAAPTYFGFAFD